MIKVMNVDITHYKNEGCKPTRENPEGLYPDIDISISTNSMIPDPSTGQPTHEHIVGKTCQCGEGHVTYGTWRTPVEGMVFENKEALMAYLRKDDGYMLRNGFPPIDQKNFSGW